MKPRLIFLGALLLILASVLPAFSANVVVGTCMPNKVSFDSIGDAVQGVPPGSTIQVCPGTYAEQVVINKSLTLKGIANGNNAYPVIVPPAAGLLGNATGLNVGFFFANAQMAAQVLIQSGADVTITGIAVDATGYNLPTCFPVVVGILVQDSSLTANGVSVKNQLETGPPPCPATGNGAGILSQNDTGGALTFKVQNSAFTNAAQAIDAEGAGTTSTLTNNSLVGNPGSNANAINVVSGTGTVQSNTITNYNYPPAGSNETIASFGIYVACSPGATVASNSVINSQVGVELDFNCASTSVSVTGNDISNASLIGIVVGETNGLVQGNAINVTQTAIRLPAVAANNVFQNNKINDACAAFGVNPAAGANSILTNTTFNVMNLTLANTTALCP